MSSSSNSKPTAALKPKRGNSGLQGARPQPLSLPTVASPPERPSKKPRVSGGRGDVVVGVQPAGPVIIYERTPKAVHVRQDEFMAVVQRLTGQHAQQQPGHHHHLQETVLPQKTETMTASPAEEKDATTSNHLVLALGNLPVLPSPVPLASDVLFPPSPGIFLFSPATMQALHELISS